MTMLLATFHSLDVILTIIQNPERKNGAWNEFLDVGCFMQKVSEIRSQFNRIIVYTADLDIMFEKMEERVYGPSTKKFVLLLGDLVGNIKKICEILPSN